MENNRLEVLRRLEAGEIDAEEALGLLRTEEPVEGEVITAAPTTTEHPTKRWQHFWLYPLAAAAGILALGGLILALVVGTGAASGWLVCGWLPVGLGLLGLLFALWSRGARWLHVRVREEGGHRIAISFPVPLTLTAWALRIARPFVPQLKETGADELVLALRDSNRDEPLHIQVDEEDGDQVEVYIG
jgi:hypothetical protein